MGSDTLSQAVKEERKREGQRWADAARAGQGSLDVNDNSSLYPDRISQHSPSQSPSSTQKPHFFPAKRINTRGL